MMLCRMLAGWLSPAGAGGALSVLIFHRVLPNADALFPEEPDERRFDAILTWLGRAFNVVPLDRAVAALGDGTLPARAVAITFDDGYADNHRIALPLLLRHRMSATFFVASDFLDGGRMWNDTVIEAVRQFGGKRLDLSALGLGSASTETLAAKRASIDRLLGALKYLPIAERLEKAEQIARLAEARLPDDLMMTSAQVRELRAAGMQIGGHTKSHPILACLNEDEARDEIAAGKSRIESILGEDISLFAYPNGRPGRDYRAEHVRMVRECGFAAAVSTSPGAARSGADVFQLPRFTPWDRSAWRFGLRLVDNMRAQAAHAA